jgi:hypothetical protein
MVGKGVMMKSRRASPPQAAIIPNRLVSSQSDFVSLKTGADCSIKARHYAQLVHDHSQLPGAHETPAAECGNDFLSHFKGKYGEAVFDNWLATQGWKPTHQPFREDYTRRVDLDDFVVHGVQIDVKTKKRGEASPYPPLVEYNVNLGKATVDAILHIFLELDPRASLDGAPAAVMLGWATKRSIETLGYKTWPGKLSENGRFTFKRHDWDLKIRHLYKPALLKDYLLGRGR